MPLMVSIPAFIPRIILQDMSSEVDQAYNDLLYACRTGDIEAAESLTLVPGIDINKVDDWDYLPLILASLCGHLELVKILLKRGALCERDTFQGERCIYGALTDEIRDLLASYDISKKVDEMQPFQAYFSSLLQPNMKRIAVPNAYLGEGAKRQPVNKFILAAILPYFLANDSVNLLDPAVLTALLDYIYMRVSTFDDTLLGVARKYQLEGPFACIRNRTSVVDDLRNRMREFLESSIFPKALEVELSEETDYEDVNTNLDASQKRQLAESLAFCDAILASIDIFDGTVRFFPVHRAMLGRAEYYKTMFSSNVTSEFHVDFVDGLAAITAKQVPVLLIPYNVTRHKVVEYLLRFLYYDETLNVPVDAAVELLYVSEALCVDRLKSVCAIAITSVDKTFSKSHLDKVTRETGLSVFELMEAAWETRCERVEQHASRLIAHNLEYLFEKERGSFLGLIDKSAQRIKERQETDTIELVDDVRFYLAKKYHVYDEFRAMDGVAEGFQQDLSGAATRGMIEGQQRYAQDMQLLDSLLEQLGLEA